MKFTIITLLILTLIGYFGMTYLSQPIGIDFTRVMYPFEEPYQSESFNLNTFNIE